MNRIVIITGVFAWVIFTFAVLKLLLVYAENRGITYLIAYNVSSIIFVLYFIGYLKERLKLHYLFFLWLAFNLGLYFSSYLYDHFILVRGKDVLVDFYWFNIIINFFVVFVVYVLSRLFKLKSKSND